jgi:F-type H+-transporting ATPase subunit epsilon
MDNLYLEIRTPDSEIFRGEVKQVILPGKEGLFGVLKNHAPLIATLQTGIVKVDALKVDHLKGQKEEEEPSSNINNKEYKFEIKGGVVEVLNNMVMVLAS